MSKPVKWVLHLRPDGPCTEDEAIRRLRAALKALLRSYRIRCLAITEPTSKPDGETGGAE